MMIKIKDKLMVWMMFAWMYHPACAFAQATPGAAPGTGTSGTAAIDTLIKRGLGLALWIAIGVSGVLGVVVFCQGVAKMWDADDPRAQKHGRAMMLWGVVLTVAVLFVVAVRDYLTNGLNLSATDLTGG